MSDLSSPNCTCFLPREGCRDSELSLREQCWFFPLVIHKGGHSWLMETEQILDDSVAVFHQQFLLTEDITDAVNKRLAVIISIDP